jgi:hypothetical protein
MYLPVDAFKHNWHSAPDGGKLGCYECHTKDVPRSADTAKQCTECHKDLIPPGSTIEVKHYQAIGYAQAMHQQCIGCHAEIAKREEKPDHARCATCHRENRTIVDNAELSSRERELRGKGIILPPY